ncbi:MAG: hypothetical protein CMJ46_01065 [Planctomyces sp.]|nr:hypothetical protein [Planctomyces sp.]
MIVRKYESPFNFHHPYRGRKLFRRWAEEAAGHFSEPPLIIDHAIFSYGVKNADSFNQLRTLGDSRPAIVYLSDIVMHESILVIGGDTLPALKFPREYASLDQFMQRPYVRGYLNNFDGCTMVDFDDSTFVISALMPEFCVRKTNPVKSRRYSLPQRYSECFAGFILDYPTYFELVRIEGDEAFFFKEMPADDHVRKCLRISLDRSGQFSIRDYLLNESIPFATIGDDHMDDAYAVSYGWDCWRIEAEQLGFIR